MEGFVSSSALRQLALAYLEEDEMKVSRLAVELGSPLQSVSRTLKELRKRNLVRCVTPDRPSNRVYRITEEGERVLDQIPAKTVQLKARRFDMKVAEVLDKAGLSYVRNEKVAGERFSGRPDFLVRGGEAKLAVEVKWVSNKSAMPSVKRAAFTHNDFKRATELKSVLVVGGSAREDELGWEIHKLEGPDFFDRIFFEDEIGDFVQYVKEEMGRYRR